uniref:Uncharacterized protein n=1 Tax=Mycena chlorophos TaxID=658473 RepID=A0ABQ0L8V4_MYCCL|nr:predicted protein [Mycena chlorophos]
MRTTWPVCIASRRQSQSRSRSSWSGIIQSSASLDHGARDGDGDVAHASCFPLPTRIASARLTSPSARPICALVAELSAAMTQQLTRAIPHNKMAATSRSAHVGHGTVRAEAHTLRRHHRRVPLASSAAPRREAEPTRSSMLHCTASSDDHLIGGDGMRRPRRRRRPAGRGTGAGGDGGTSIHAASSAPAPWKVEKKGLLHSGALLRARATNVLSAMTSPLAPPHATCASGLYAARKSIRAVGLFAGVGWVVKKARVDEEGDAAIGAFRVLPRFAALPPLPVPSSRRVLLPVLHVPVALRHRTCTFPVPPSTAPSTYLLLQYIYTYRTIPQPSHPLTPHCTFSLPAPRTALDHPNPHLRSFPLPLPVLGLGPHPHHHRVESHSLHLVGASRWRPMTPASFWSWVFWPGLVIT